MGGFDEIKDRVLPVLMPYGVEEVALFGSVVRGEDMAENDLDILVRFAEPPRKPLSLITWGRLERELGERCGRKVGLVSDRGLSRHLRPHVEAEKIVIFTEAR
jgi:uncharacterized protein